MCTKNTWIMVNTEILENWCLKSICFMIKKKKKKTKNNKNKLYMAKQM